ncbi:MAG: DUF721 domain-containing protein, partial [Deltaproteobacteria bacterium]|nr:DUF721 domain-containing protein [Deltaproteobacteria bacterium]
MPGKEKEGFTRVNDVLGAALKEFKVDEVFRVHPIWSAWENLVGPAVARKTHPDFVQGKTLIVSVENSVWMQELEMQKREFVKKISEMKLPFEITEIRFR